MPAINDSAASARARLDAVLGDAPFSLLRPLDDEAAWRDAFARTGCDPADAIAEGDRALQTADWSPIPDDLYLEFSRNGNRVNYQKALAEKTAPLNALLLAECAERQGRFVPAIVAALFIGAWIDGSAPQGITTAWSYALPSVLVAWQVSRERRRVETGEHIHTSTIPCAKG